MTEPTDALMGNLKRELTSRPSWDEAPALYMIHGDNIVHLEIPTAMWGQAPDRLILASLAEAIHAPEGQAMLKTGLDSEPTGFAFRYEAHMVVRSLNTVPAALRNRPDKWTHGNTESPRNAPDRLEIRAISAVTMYGARYLITQERPTGTLNVFYDAPGARERGVAGDIPDVLADMAFALQAAGAGGTP